MGRTKKHLDRLRVELGECPGPAEITGVAGRLETIAGKLPRLDAAIAPVLRDLAGRAAEAADSVGVAGFLAGLDAAAAFVAGRGDPVRDQLLEVARDLATTPIDAHDPDFHVEQSAPSGLPATFVGDLPGESTLDDATLLLVQLEPSDGYGVQSLVTILENLAADGRRPAGERGPLREAASILASSPPTDAALHRVGVILEGLNGDDRAASETPAAAPVVHGAAAPLSWRPDADTDIDLMREFLVESRDLLASAEESLLALEADPADPEAVNVVFRAFHTIKGTSGFLGLEQSAELCHHAESLLSKVRDGSIAFDPDIADVSLRSVDLLGAILGEVGVALEGREPDGLLDLAPVIRRLDGLTDGTATIVEETIPTLGSTSTRDSGNARPRGDSSVRVRTDRLDGLVNLVGELVIAQSMIAQDGVVQDGAHRELAKKVGHAGKIVRELQDLSMALRMVPLRSTFSKLQRLVRDLARKNGKRVQLFTEGEETEIDRTMVDILGDPLVHMIRNAMDHGLESSKDREAAGKSEVGTLWVRAYHAGGNVVVELEDDGRGMDRDRILAKAMERGLIRSPDGMTDGEVWKLVFEPGFSTADQVTDVSGRGVGMDVVRRNIESLRGRIEVDSTTGAGTRITLRLPLTLAITEGMLMGVGRERYILPTLSIERNVRPTSEMLSTVAGRGEMLLLRDELLPVVRLHELFRIDGGRTKLEEGLLVVIGAAERRCALFVDELLGQQQVVVKSLGEGLGKLEGVTGGAVLGDGTVGLILDAGELVNLARQGDSAPRAA